MEDMKVVTYPGERILLVLINAYHWGLAQDQMRENTGEKTTTSRQLNLLSKTTRTRSSTHWTRMKISPPLKQKQWIWRLTSPRCKWLIIWDSRILRGARTQGWTRTIPILSKEYWKSKQFKVATHQTHSVEIASRNLRTIRMTIMSTCEGITRIWI